MLTSGAANSALIESSSLDGCLNDVHMTFVRMNRARGRLGQLSHAGSRQAAGSSHLAPVGKSAAGHHVAGRADVDFEACY
jgi:hypothetical protein